MTACYACHISMVLAGIDDLSRVATLRCPACGYVILIQLDSPLPRYRLEEEQLFGNVAPPPPETWTLPKGSFW